ncbi:hypothetical protein [Cupriavidus basilensis]|uniref:Uncharacterized protein n=1 Tax=Cupriavidus basilensis TaxID=68895 RepID=A0A0C4YBQ8_9BURK|nr:hypothetical protein [Cupriavidus basilensis]AJG23012.1 hypothetical protein RR42_s1424 [Cupriavidus basilensis]
MRDSLPAFTLPTQPPASSEFAQIAARQQAWLDEASRQLERLA